VSAADDGSWFARGQAHRRAGRAVDALLCYREALAADRYAIQARFHLGEALRDLGRDGDAFDAWHTVLTVQPGARPMRAMPAPDRSRRVLPRPEPASR
jgi:tetratricopeptide (TPR) repeat protein